MIEKLEQFNKEKDWKPVESQEIRDKVNELIDWANKSDKMQDAMFAQVNRLEKINEDWDKNMEELSKKIVSMD